MTLPKLYYFKNWLQARRSGFLREDSDSRDYQYVAGGTSDPLPEEVDLRDQFLPVRDQGLQNSCTGFATAALMEYWLNKGLGNSMTLSPLFSWYFGKKFHGWQGENKGVWLRYTLKSLYQDGIVDEKSFPYKSPYLRSPTLNDYYIIRDVIRFYLKENTEYYTMVPEMVMESLAEEYPVVFGIYINKSFYGNTNGIITSDEPLGLSHAMVAVGYTDDCIIARNSWGKKWGAAGYCYIPKKYFIDNAHDCWAIMEK